MSIATGQVALAADALALATKVKLLSHTRDMTAAAGDVSYTGYGFQPKALIIFAALASYGVSFGFGDVNLAEAVVAVYGTTPIYYVLTTQIIYISDGTNIQNANVKTLDADGFTLTWEKSNTPSGTATMIVLAIY